MISSSSITASYNLDEFEMRVKAVDNNLSLYKDKNYIAVYPMKFYIEALVQSVSKQLNAKATVDKEKLRQDVTAVWNKIMNCKRNCFSTDEKILFQIIKMKNLNLIVLYINLRNFILDLYDRNVVRSRCICHCIFYISAYCITNLCLKIRKIKRV